MLSDNVLPEGRSRNRPVTDSFKGRLARGSRGAETHRGEEQRRGAATSSDEQRRRKRDSAETRGRDAGSRRDVEQSRRARRRGLSRP
jgi:hypothetical protein